MNTRISLLCLPLLLALLTRLHAGLPARLADRTILSIEHVDIRVLDQPSGTNELTLVARDEDRGMNHEATNVVLRGTAGAQLTLPGGFEMLGDEGAPFWVLPQSQDPSLLYLGLSAEGIPGGRIAGPVSMALTAVRGPGDFFVWQFDGVSGLNLAMNSRDGIDASDATSLAVGSHGHFNWGFSSNGIYEITFQATARRPGATNDISSPPTTFVFALEPVPDEPEPTAFELWQEAQWPGVEDPAVIAATADPDGDGTPNALEFFAGTDPRSTASAPVFRAEILPATDAVPARCAVSIRGRTERAALVELTFQASNSPGWTSPETLPTPVATPLPDGPEGAGMSLVRSIDSKFVDQAATRYYRVGVRLR